MARVAGGGVGLGREEKMFLKLLFILAGMLVIGYILAVSIRMNRIRQPEGNYIRLQDVLILTQALDGKFEANYGSDGRYAVWQEALAVDGESKLTYGQFLDWADMLRADIPETPGDREIRSMFGRKYRDSHFMLEEDWFACYDALLEDCGMQDTVSMENVTVLGVGSEVSDGEGGVLPDYTLFAEEGIFPFRSDAFAEHKYQVIRVYQKGGELLTVREVVSRGMDWENVWIMEAEEKNRLQVFYREHEIWVPYEKAESPWREQVADFGFADGRLQSVKVKADKVSGKLLSVRDGELEIEGAGKYPYAENLKVYKLYGALAEGGWQELRIGYDFTDFVLEDGVICAGLTTRDGAMENIRVVIKNTGYAGAYHEEVRLTADTDFALLYGEPVFREGNPDGQAGMERKEFRAGEVVTIDGDSEYFKGDRIYIEPAALTGRIRLLSVERSQGEPAYRGKMEIAKTPEGLVVVNELLLEEYLYSVVPSEMPASYPLEALKAQAVCARTYAYRNMTRSGIAAFGAHVDDSAGYQVYNNISENAQTTKAVRETTGQLLYYGEELCGAYYYSTSCGFGTDAGVWKSGSAEDTSYLRAKRIGEEGGEYGGEDMAQEEKFREFIQTTHDSDYESGEAWYRWEYEVEEIDKEQLLENIRKRYETNPNLIQVMNRDGEYESREVGNLGDIKDIYVAGRGDGGVADELVIEGTGNTVKVLSEHNIRYVLNNGDGKVVRQDGSEVSSQGLLPSGYLVITAGKKDDVVVGYRLTGGGYGHGVGMSQNGAKEMAKKGFTSEDILTFFYESCVVKDVY